MLTCVVVSVILVIRCLSVHFTYKSMYYIRTREI